MQLGINQNMISQPLPQSLHRGQAVLGRHELLADADDARFVPEGMMPGIRPVSGSRNRDIGSGPIFPNQVEENLQYNMRQTSQQRGGLDQGFGPLHNQFNGQSPNGSRGVPGFQQQQQQQQAFRGGPSPIANFNAGQIPPQQRLPPGLANLGVRPPHDSSQFMGNGVGNFGMPSQAVHPGLQHLNVPQSLGQLQNSGPGIMGNQGQLRGQPNIGQVGNPMGLGNIDFRGGLNGPPQNQLVGLGGPNAGPGIRGGQGFNAQQQLHGQVPPGIGIRQNIPPHLMQQLIQPQMQQHGLPGGQPTPADFMALLMGGAQRE